MLPCPHFRTTRTSVGKESKRICRCSHFNLWHRNRLCRRIGVSTSLTDKQYCARKRGEGQK